MEICTSSTARCSTRMMPRESRLTAEVHVARRRIPLPERSVFDEGNMHNKTIYRILLVDDHPSVMLGTKMMLEQEEDFEVVVASPHDDIVSLAAEGEFDVMLFDLMMPGLSGVELSKRVLEHNPDATILIYTGFDITPHFRQLVKLGVIGFVSKTASQAHLIRAVRCALNRETVIPYSLLRALCKESLGYENQTGLVRLTEREIEILKQVAQGKSNKKISESMHMSQRSLEYALTQVYHKLSVHSRVEAVSKAKSLGILLDEDFIRRS